jgi:hypothetical protein
MGTMAGLFLFGFSADVIKIGGNKDPAYAWPVRIGQVSVKELIGAVAEQTKRADDDGHDPLGEAKKRLEQPLLDAGVETIGKLIGCR